MHCTLSNHAVQRSAQRSITPKEIEDCLLFGEIIHQRKAEVFYLTKKLCVLHKLPVSHAGVSVIVDSTGDVIISVFKTEDRKRLAKTASKLKKKARLSRRQLYFQQRLVQNAAV